MCQARQVRGRTGRQAVRQPALLCFRVLADTPHLLHRPHLLPRLGAATDKGVQARREGQRVYEGQACLDRVPFDLIPVEIVFCKNTQCEPDACQASEASADMDGSGNPVMNGSLLSQGNMFDLLSQGTSMAPATHKYRSTATTKAQQLRAHVESPQRRRQGRQTRRRGAGGPRASAGRGSWPIAPRCAWQGQRALG